MDFVMGSLSAIVFLPFSVFLPFRFCRLMFCATKTLSLPSSISLHPHLRVVALLVTLLPLLAGCERELLLLDPSLQIQGYEVRGVVGDRFGNPIPGVGVTVDYLLEYVNDGPEPLRTYQVPSPGEAITVSVVNRVDQPVFTYAAGTQEPGSFIFIWDQTYPNGQPVPPGAYSVRYVAPAGVRLSYPVLVSGNQVTTTDSLGRYTIRDPELPVDFYPVPDYSSNGTTYYGNLRVTSQVILGFMADGMEVYRTVQLTRDQVVILDARLN